MVQYVIRQNIKYFGRLLLSNPSINKYELKGIFAKAKEIKMMAHHTRMYADLRASIIQHSIPSTEMYSCQIVISI